MVLTALAAVCGLLVGVVTFLQTRGSGDVTYVLSSARSLEPDELQDAAAAVRARLATLGVTADVVASSTVLHVKAPDAAEEAVRNAVSTVGDLQFRPVVLVGSANLDTPVPSSDPIQRLIEQTSCTTEQRALDPAEQVVACSRDGHVKYLLGPAELLGDTLRTANATAAEDGRWMVEFDTTPAGAKRFEQVTTRYVDQPLAIVVDGVVQSAPLIQGPIKDEGQITGDFREADARQLALVLAHPLPARFTVSSVRR